MFKSIGSKRSHGHVFIPILTAGLFSVWGCSGQSQGPVYHIGSSTAALTRPDELGTATSINWKRLTDRAVAENRPVYILFSASWCPHCWAFQLGTLSKSDVQRALRRVIYLKANADQESLLADRFGLSGIPSGVLLRPQNQDLVVVDKHIGGLPAAKFIDFLHRASAQ